MAGNIWKSRLIPTRIQLPIRAYSTIEVAAPSRCSEARHLAASCCRNMDEHGTMCLYRASVSRIWTVVSLMSFASGVLTANDMPRDILDESDEGVIEWLQLRETDFLKRAAVMLFHPALDRFVMEVYVKIGYFRGSELLYQDIVEGDLFTQVNRTIDLLYTKYTRALISYDGVYGVKNIPVPREAMLEEVINAIIHRDYASPTTIQIRVYDDKITIWNDGEVAPRMERRSRWRGIFVETV